MEPLDPCRVCLGTGLSLGGECLYCEGTCVDHDPSDIDGTSEGETR